MKILYTTVEAAPFLKIGGLGDVMRDLPREIAKDENNTVKVILPMVKGGTSVWAQTETDFKLDFKFFDYTYIGDKNQYVGVWSWYDEVNNLEYVFLENDDYFGAGQEAYGAWNDGERFIWFSKAVAQILDRLDWKDTRVNRPDIVNVNDYHTALIPFFMKTEFAWKTGYTDIKTTLTIHNMQFQGRMNSEVINSVMNMSGKLYPADYDKLMQENDLNMLKAGIEYVDRVTTVSPNYAREIMTPEFGFGLDGILRYHSSKVMGIVNGIGGEDVRLTWSNLSDLERSRWDYDWWRTGKGDAMANLSEHFGWEREDNRAIYSIVSRLTDQKGFDALLPVLYSFLEQRPNTRLVVLGTGQPEIEQGFCDLQDRFKEQVRFVAAYDAQLARAIYRGSTFLLMPSRFEPCGLSQMIAQAHSTLPIVNGVGGLVDTVEKDSNGFMFHGLEFQSIIDTLNYAQYIFEHNKSKLFNMMVDAMDTDNSWKNSAEKYQDLYTSLVGQYSIENDSDMSETA